MSHMQPEITDRIQWLAIDTQCGMTYLPWDIVPQSAKSFINFLNGHLCNSDEFSEDVASDVLVYTDAHNEGQITHIFVMWGHGARLSASGYLDCTEWATFDTEKKAAQYLLNIYGSDGYEPYDWEAELEEIANKA